jgi:hypothetical protein
VRPILRANALFDLAVGLILGAATWDALYKALGAHKPNPAPLAQLAGIFFCAFAYLLWIAPRDVRLTRAVAAGSAFANGATVLLVLAWELPGRVGLPARDDAALVAVAVVCGAFAVAEAVIASRSVAMLLPPD